MWSMMLVFELACVAYLDRYGGAKQDNSLFTGELYTLKTQGSGHWDEPQFLVSFQNKRGKELVLNSLMQISSLEFDLGFVLRENMVGLDVLVQWVD